MSGERPLPLTKTITPALEAEVADALRTAYAETTAVYPLGGGTALDYGAEPAKPGMGLSLQKLDRLIDYQPEDMTVTVEAGMTLAELSKILIKRRQRLPIDVARPDRATIGGAAAINPFGPRQFACGTLRDYVLGFTAVDGQGLIFSGGGRVLKNNAGYNLGRLMIGSLGTLGIITRLTLLVRPAPEMSALAACDLPDLQTAEKLLAKLIESPISPAAVELALGPGRQDNPVLVPMPKTAAARLIVGLEGPRACVQWMLDALRNMWQAAGVASPMTVTNAWAKSLWDWLADFPAQVQIAVSPGAVTNMIAALLSLDPVCTIQAHAGNGVLRATFSQNNSPHPDPLPKGEGTFAIDRHADPLPTPTKGQSGDETDDSAPRATFALFLRTRLRPLVERCGGKLTVLKNPQDNYLTCRDIWGPKGDGFAVMQSLKDRFDPAGILNPGRFIFEAPSRDGANLAPVVFSPR